MSLKAKIEAVIYASEEPVTLLQLVSLLGQEAQAELEAARALQGELALGDTGLPDLEPLTLDEEGDAMAEETDADAEEPDAVAGEPDALAGEPDALAGEPDAVAEEPSSELRPPELIAPEADPTPAGQVASPFGEHASPAAEVSEPSAAELRGRERRLREYMRSVLDELMADYNGGDRGLEIREIAGGFRFATKPEYHDAVRGFVRSLKPPLKLSLQALETLAVIAYKQPVTAPEISEIRGVDSGGVIGSLMTRRLVTTAGRKQVIGRPILYKTTKEFLLRFGLKDLGELPSIEEFERLASDMNEAVQEEIPMPQNETPIVPIGVAAETTPLSPEQVMRDVEPSRNQHMAQADGDPNASIPTADEVDAEHLTPAADGPGEFTGDETVPPAINTVNDGRISGMPPSYDNLNDEAADSPANDAVVQSGEDR